MLFELAFEALEKGEGISRGAGAACQYAVFVPAPYLAGIGLHDRVAQGDLAVPAHHDQVVAPDRTDGGSAIVFHLRFPSDLKVQNVGLAPCECKTAAAQGKAAAFALNWPVV